MATGKYTPLAGGTDLMVEQTSRRRDFIFIHALPELRGLSQDESFIRVGAATTFTEIMAHPLAPALLKKAVSQIAAPAIRNLGTVGGNIANGSAKADSALIFSVTDSLLVIAGSRGRREARAGEFYLGRKRLDLGADELIVEILIPRINLTDHYYQKIGGRAALAISRLSLAGLFREKDGVIAHLAVAFGAISDTIVRRPDIDGMLIGKTVSEARELRDSYLKAYEGALRPNDGRVSREYRQTVAMNLLYDFLRTFGL
jgi:CO/xanthine dehydrogenase FAD-binding subunit